MDYLKNIAVSAAIALAPLGLSAAPIDLASFNYQIDALVETRGAFIDFTDPFLSAADATFNLSVSVFDVDDPATAGFTFFEPGGAGVFQSELSGSSAIAFGDSPNFVQYLFEGVSGAGSLSGLDGRAMLVEVIGGQGLDLSQSPLSTEGTITITSLNKIPSIPLPAGALLLITGIVSLCALGARRRSA